MGRRIPYLDPSAEKYGVRYILTLLNMKYAQKTILGANDAFMQN